MRNSYLLISSNLLLHLAQTMLVVDVSQAHEEVLCCQFVIANTPQFGLHRCAESVRAIGTLQNRHIGLPGIVFVQSGREGLQFLVYISLSYTQGSAVLQRRLAKCRFFCEELINLHHRCVVISR